MKYRRFSDIAWVLLLALVLGGVLWTSSGPFGAPPDVAAATLRVPQAGPLSSITIYGPNSGETDVEYAFTTQISPTDATLPITYTWWPEPISGQNTATATYSWATTGNKTITVTANNPYNNLVGDFHTINISPPNIPVKWVSISGPESGAQGVTYHFSATVNLTATTPISYEWSPLPGSGQYTRYAAYSWDDAGPHTISVTAYNDFGTALDYHAITIVPIDVPVEYVNINGPTTGTVGLAYSFTAVAGPVSATTPITYTWIPTPDSGQGTATATYSWDVTGPHFITVTASNGSGQASNSHAILIAAIPVDSVAIDGPTAGWADSQYSFTAEVSPISATTPIAYNWSPPPYSGQGTATAIYSWAIAGSKLMTVTAQNDNGYAVDTHSVIISNVIIPVNLVQVFGPTSGAVNTVYTFTTVITPANATAPIAYSWTPAPISGQGTATATYSWSSVGQQSILVVADNDVGYASDSHVINITTGGIPIDSVKISGPITGAVNTTYTFTATISPADAEKPIVYTWSPTPDAGQGAANAAYSWDAAGYKIVTVKASNGSSNATAAKTLFIVAANTPVQAVKISGPIFGRVNTPYKFTTAVTPPDATTPISYTWSPEPVSGQGEATATYTWTVAGNQTLSVTANNGSGPVGNSYSIMIKGDLSGSLYLPTVLRAFTSVALPVPVQTVKIAGPILGGPNIAYSFTAIVSPTNATTPITYTWSPTPTGGQGTATATYSWTVFGAMAVTVVAQNDFSSAESTHAITIAVGVQSVEIVGPPLGKVNIPYSFMAIVSPTNAATPITYTWAPAPAGVQGAATAAYSWDTPGVKMISVIADNGISIATDVHVITITNASVLTGPAATAASVEPSKITRPATVEAQ